MFQRQKELKKIQDTVYFEKVRALLHTIALKRRFRRHLSTKNSKISESNLIIKKTKPAQDISAIPIILVNAEEDGIAGNTEKSSEHAKSNISFSELPTDVEVRESPQNIMEALKLSEWNSMLKKLLTLIFIRLCCFIL